MNSVSKSNLYKILYETFTKDQTILKQQNREYHTMNLEELTNHFENHVVTIERAILHDVCIIKQLMNELEQKMRTKQGIESAILIQWQKLSSQKINLIGKLKKVHYSVKIPEPYNFST